MGRARVQRDVVVQQVRALFTLGTIDGMTDGRLLERFTTFADESAEAAFAALVERHGPMVLRVCRSVLHDRHDAEDAFQATFLVMVRRARSLWVRDSLGPWLYQVAHRTAARARTIEDQRRRRERKAALGLVAEVEERPPDDLDEALHEEVARLPERYRAAVVLCLLEGLPNEQAARRLGWPVGTVQSRLARGRERLKRSLTRRGLAPSVAVAAATALPPKLAQATLQSALRYAATGSQAAAISSSILALTEGVLRMMTLAKWKTGLLALTAVGGLGLATAVVPRSIGADGQEPAKAPAPPIQAAKEDPESPASEVPVTPVPSSPIESTVLIRVKHEATEANARGTIIKSTPEETIILTSGHLFRSEAGRIAVESMKLKVTYCGRTRVLVGTGPSTGLTANGYRVEQSDAELIDCDTRRDVALVRIRPGEMLPFSPIVPRSWEPRSGTRMTTIQSGSGELFGNLAECSILGVRKGGLPSNSDFEAISCDLAPIKRGPGVGLFTTKSNGKPSLLAGVYNFASSGPVERQGFYASPKMIYAILDKNGLSSLYQAEDPRPSPAPEPDFPIQRLRADAGTSAAPRHPEPPQSSDPAQPSAPAQQPAPKSPSKTSWLSDLVRLEIGRDAPKQALGTIIKSTPDESIVLTCASVFNADGKALQDPPSISVRLTTFPPSDKACPGELVDVDPVRNVALVRLRQGRLGTGARIVPPSWKPRRDLDMQFSNVRQGYVSSTPTKILRPRVKSGTAYEAIECSIAPREAAVGGGLFIVEQGGRQTNYLAGVCNFASPGSDAGLYASPMMIYPILDKNGLSALYRTGNEDMNFAPEPDFRESEAEGLFAPAGQTEALEADRARKVERRVDVIDGKLDEILRLLKQPR